MTTKKKTWARLHGRMKSIQSPRGLCQWRYISYTAWALEVQCSFHPGSLPAGTWGDGVGWV